MFGLCCCFFGFLHLGHFNAIVLRFSVEVGRAAFCCVGLYSRMNQGW